MKDLMHCGHIIDAYQQACLDCYDEKWNKVVLRLEAKVAEGEKREQAMRDFLATLPEKIRAHYGDYCCGHDGQTWMEELEDMASALSCPALRDSRAGANALDKCELRKGHEGNHQRKGVFWNERDGLLGSTSQA